MVQNKILRQLKIGKILIILILILFVGCVNNDNTIKILKSNGYKNIIITGYRPFMGNDDDIFKTGFEAISPNGEKVTGAVTGDYFQGYTIRLD